MAEMILEPTAQSKVIPLSLRLNDTDTSLVSQLVTNRQFNTADTDAWFSFTLEGLAATTGTFDLTLINLHDKSVFNHTDKVFNTNPFYYKLDSGTDELTNEIRHAGKWVGQLVVTLANGDSATRKFIFGIEGHILDGTVVQTILLEDYNALIASIESAKDELTQYNIDYASLIGTVTEQEAARLEAEELRVIADALRETKEGVRQATFEANEVIRDGVVDSAIEGEMISQTVTTKLTEKEATYAPRLLSVEQQLADKVTQGVSCTELKMVSNDQANGIDNFTKLVNAINQGYKILVDDNYYLETTLPASIDKSIVISGLNEKSKFIIKNGNTLFNATSNCKNILIEKVYFNDTPGTNLTLIFDFSGTLYFENVDVSRCSFEGNISLIRYVAPTNLNPEITVYGFGTFRFEDNSVENTHFSFIVLTNLPCNVYYICRNKVKNFDYVFVNIGIDNGHEYPDEISNAIKLSVTENNYVVCDDEWWSNWINGVYFCFLLFEGVKAIYKNNHVEGLKSNYVIAVYDAYFGAKDVDYFNNTWKNNICFNSSNTNYVLMKAKAGLGLKRYCNNNYIVEVDYASRLGKDPALTKVRLYESQAEISRWEIVGNVIDVYSLEFQMTSDYSLETWIKNNVFKCVYAAGALINARIESNKDYSNMVHEISGNTIEIQLVGESNTFRIAMNTDYSNGTNLFGKFIIANNKVKVYDMGYALNTVRARTVELKENIIEIVSSTPSVQALMSYCVVSNFINVNNIIIKPGGKYREPLWEYVGEVTESYIVKDKGPVDSSSKVSFSVANPITIKYRYVRKYEILCTLGLVSFYATMDYYYDGATGYNMLSFIGSDDVVGNYKLSKSTDTSGSGEGHGKFLKLIGSPSTVKLYFTNNRYGNSIYLSGLPDGYKVTKIETYTAVV